MIEADTPFLSKGGDSPARRVRRCSVFYLGRFHGRVAAAMSVVSFGVTLEYVDR